MKLVVGLGNPGPGHARQRHNVGFMAVDAIAARHAIGPMRRRFHGEAAEGRIGKERVLILKPQTFMNESGRSVGEAARFYKIGPEDIIVLHDEIDLAPGKVRVKRGGGVAGHNGLKSLAAHIGPDFFRVRIGIGHPGARHLVQRHVLGDFAKADMAWVEPLLDAIAAGAEKLVAGDQANFMNEIARAVPSGDAPAAPPAPEAPHRRPTAKGKLAASRPKAPSQRELAKSAAERRKGSARKGGTKGQSDAPAPQASPETPRRESPFSILRRIFTGTRPTDRT